jgi:hypothetical protein
MGQLYFRNLHQEFFERYPKETTHFFALSGFLGFVPVERLMQMPFKSTVIHGLQRENRDFILHEQMKKIHGDKVSIHYPEIPSHAKCYLWFNENKPIRGLIGSANFTRNGLHNDYRESLLELEKPDLFPLQAYINIILESSKFCVDIDVAKTPSIKTFQSTDDSCKLELYDKRTGQVPGSSGLNWGFANAHVAIGDAYIAIRVEHIKKYPHLFQPIFFNPSQGHRSRVKSKEAVEIIWDDGVIMEALFEGSQPVNEMIYPKQISSVPRKNILGDYIRFRLGLPPVTNSKREDEKITREILTKYGRDTIELKLIQPGVYSANFSVG